MEPVRFGVENVVDDIVRPRQKAEHGEGGQCPEKERDVEHLFGEDEGGGHKEVFGPLRGPQRNDGVPDRHASLLPGRRRYSTSSRGLIK